jgi:hypothetical protein
MKSKLIFIFALLAIALITLSSCSSSKYGYGCWQTKGLVGYGPGGWKKGVHF